MGSPTLHLFRGDASSIQIPTDTQIPSDALFAESEAETVDLSLDLDQEGSSKAPSTTMSSTHSIPSRGEGDIHSVVPMASVPVDGFSTITGLHSAKLSIFVHAILPHKLGRPSTPKVILLHGPPGSGKTSMSSSIAAELGVPHHPVLLTSLMSKYVGTAESFVRQLFTTTLSSYKHGVVFFFDEVDALNNTSQTDSGEIKSDRASGSALTQLLISLTDISRSIFSKPVVVVMATNFPETLSRALVRRFTLRVFVGYLGSQDRMQLIERWLSTHEVKVEGENVVSMVSELTDGWSSSDLLILMDHAAEIRVLEASISCGVGVKKRKLLPQSTDDVSVAEEESWEVTDELVKRLNCLRAVSFNDFRSARENLLSIDEE